MWVAIVLLILYIIMYFISGDKIYKKQYIFDDLLKNNEKIQVNISGEFVSSQTGEKSVQIVLKHVRLDVYETSDHSLEKENYLPFIIIYTDNISEIMNPGNIIKCNGSLMNIRSATNPGEFDLRKYYREKKIYYMAWCSEKDIKIADSRSDFIKTFLFKTRDRIKNVYIKCLPQKEAGIISAMLLGDKSIIDTNIKELYRQNGIGHLLAISGLHVTILCMAFTKLLYKLKVDEKVSVILMIFFLLLYGMMTGFGVSTSRAVIMMLLSLIAKVSKRSYDMLSAMAVSAVIIVIQKPFALFSCSFLLSYGAIVAIAVLYPFLKENLISNEDMIQHKATERFIDYIFIEIKKSLLMSFSIQFFTLPIVLFYYFETPTYGLILNIIILPFSNILVISGAIGGILGLVFIPAGKFFLGTAYMILNIFEKSCEMFTYFPFHTIVTGRPAVYKIFLFYLVIMTAILFFNKLDMMFFMDNMRKSCFYNNMVNFAYKFKDRTVSTFFIIAVLLLFILLPKKDKTFNISFLDIGQGDCIVMRSESGKVYMIDGGSSSKKNIGKYIITPYLKYYGITKIDYCIITHSDSDHVSGIIEILEQKYGDKIEIDNFLLQDPDDTLKDDTYKQILQLAGNNCKKVSYIKRFDMIKDGKLNLVCVHPESGYMAESANAYSTVISITHGSDSILLTGDLEKDGEKQVLDILNQSNYAFPESYTILKAAHHGSKNSTSEEFLQRINPDMTIISCGKNNRYGHPHDELLNRLEKINTTVLRTDIDGAIILPLDNHPKV